MDEVTRQVAFARWQGEVTPAFLCQRDTSHRILVGTICRISGEYGTNKMAMAECPDCGYVQPIPEMVIIYHLYKTGKISKSKYLQHLTGRNYGRHNQGSDKNKTGAES